MNPQESNQNESTQEHSSISTFATESTTSNTQFTESNPATDLNSVKHSQKIGKFKASKMLVYESFQILKKNKELAWFPVFTAVSILIALIIFAIVIFITTGDSAQSFFNSQNKEINLALYLVIFVCYLLIFFITNYFLAGIYTIVNAKFNGVDLKLRDGINNANINICKIFIWSAISATVGIVLRIISDKSEFIGKIIVGLLGAAWTMLTYFSLPSLIIGKKSITESFKESASMFRKTWGETIIVNSGTELFFGLITIVIAVILIGIAKFAPSSEVIVLIVFLFFVYIVAVFIFASTLDSIIKCALYEYSRTGTVPKGFTPNLIQGVFTSKK